MLPTLQVKQAVETKLERTFTEFTAKEFITQVVAGTNYIMKVKADSEEYLHVKVHKPLPFRNAPPQLMGVLAAKTETDPLTYFE
jgi:cystatin-A/B